MSAPQESPSIEVSTELQRVRHGLVETGEDVRHKEEDGVEGLNWQPSVVGRTCRVQAILFIGPLHALSCNPKGLIRPRTFWSASHGPAGGTMTDRTSTLMPRTNSVNDTHTVGTNGLMNMGSGLRLSVVPMSQGISSKLCEILEGLQNVQVSAKLSGADGFLSSAQFYIS